MTINKPQLIWLDYVRFIGILLVVLGHLEPSERLMNFIYAFHMVVVLCCVPIIYLLNKWLPWMFHRRTQ